MSVVVVEEEKELLAYALRSETSRSRVSDADDLEEEMCDEARLATRLGLWRCCEVLEHGDEAQLVRWRGGGDAVSARFARAQASWFDLHKEEEQDWQRRRGIWKKTSRNFSKT